MLWILSNIGILHRTFVDRTTAPLTPYWYGQLFLFFFIPIVNVSKFPECVWPGKFDIVGSSHQLMHILTSVRLRVTCVCVCDLFVPGCGMHGSVLSVLVLVVD